MEIAPLVGEDLFLLSKLLAYDAAERGEPPAGVTEGLVRAIEAGEIKFFLVREQSAAVGFAAFSVDFDYATLSLAATLHHCYLLPDFRKKGYGNAMLSYLERAAESYGARSVIIRGERGTLPASFGFTSRSETVWQRTMQKEESKHD